jgi:hypothetical protein
MATPWARVASQPCWLQPDERLLRPASLIQRFKCVFLIVLPGQASFRGSTGQGGCRCDRPSPLGWLVPEAQQQAMPACGGTAASLRTCHLGQQTSLCTKFMSLCEPCFVARRRPGKARVGQAQRGHFPGSKASFDIHHLSKPLGAIQINETGRLHTRGGMPAGTLGPGAQNTPHAGGMRSGGGACMQARRGGGAPFKEHARGAEAGPIARKGARPAAENCSRQGALFKGRVPRWQCAGCGGGGLGLPCRTRQRRLKGRGKGGVPCAPMCQVELEGQEGGWGRASRCWVCR